MTRTALGVRLRELRTACPGGRLTGSEPAARPGWEQSRISELENGRQTATPEDLRLRAVATGHPGTYDELQARLQGFESHVRARVAEPGRGRPLADNNTRTSILGEVHRPVPGRQPNGSNLTKASWVKSGKREANVTAVCISRWSSP
ncbi:helix-turn-helix domain-containing protein [Streptomyces sp. NBC_00057]|uniref:helix-turn-helix domain-containing protein n=1 Tax=Streptomyces sp. NBC_00057 TaxID=2975634 RepID=UPI00386BF59E